MMEGASSHGLKVAVVGATGVIGGQLVELLAERSFPFSELKLFASERGAVEMIGVGDDDRPVAEFNGPADLAGFDLAFLAVSPGLASDIVRARPGPLLIDLSAAGRIASSSVLMVAPGLTSRERLHRLKTGEVVAIPHPSVQALATIVKALDATPGFIAATLMMGASTGGKDEIDKLMEESADLLNARLDIEDDEQQRAFNIYPVDDEAEVVNALASQVAALLGETPPLVMRVVQVPIFYGIALSIAIPTVPGIETCSERLRAAPGLILIEDEMPPSAIDSAGQEGIAVSLHRNSNGAALWCVIDNARLSALCAVWVAENLSLASDSV
ncbi:MAG TPA: Asd/ArgC dimerization domain-containing protein [Candidatus Binataceae bacterium]|nr:Asd/ArgC dimerization domain-containing protein [Candidatus Binataceae bacterium]